MSLLTLTRLLVCVWFFSVLAEVVSSYWEDDGQEFLCWRNATNIGVDMTTPNASIVALFRVNCRRKPLLGIWLRSGSLIADIPVLYAPCWPSRVSMRCYMYFVNARSRKLVTYAPGANVIQVVDEDVAQSTNGHEHYSGVLETKASLKINKYSVNHGGRFDDHALRKLSSVISRRRADRSRMQLKLLRRVASARFNGKAVRVVVGCGNIAHDRHMPGWICTDKFLLDLTRPSDFDAVFAENQVDAFIAEHVLEHLDLKQIHLALITLRAFLSTHGNLRLAVPDVFSINVDDPLAISKDFFDGHQVQLSHEYLRTMLGAAGFLPKALEYEQQRHVFWVSGVQHGRIQRSSFHDPRGAVSIIFDATPRAAAEPRSDNYNAIGRLLNLLDACSSEESACSESSVDRISFTVLSSAWEAELYEFHKVLRRLLSDRVDSIQSWIRDTFALGNDKHDLQELWHELVTIVNSESKVDTQLLDIVKYTHERITLGTSGTSTNLSKNPNATISGQPKPQATGNAVYIGREHQRLNQSVFDYSAPYQRPNQLVPRSNTQSNELLSCKPTSEEVNDLRRSETLGFQQPPSLADLKDMADVAPDLVFVTLVLNGMPFIRYHIKQFNRLESRLSWQWHIIEGVALGRAHWLYPYVSTPIPASFYTRNGRSVDGTSAYIDALALRFPGKVVIHRRDAWRDKVEMLNAVLVHISAPAILMQIDADELWTAKQISDAVDMLQTRKAGCAYFHCHFHVTPELLTSTTHAYSHNNDVEWLRMWKYRPGMLWIAHAPPKLVSKEGDTWTVVEKSRCVQHSETEALGLVFTHHAYSHESQVAFKEAFYGYPAALEQWRALRKATNEGSVDVNVSAFLAWVGPGTVRAVGRLTPSIAAGVPVIPLPSERPSKHLVIDTVVFQLLPQGGIARVWQSLLPILLSRMWTLGWDVTLLLRGKNGLPFEMSSLEFVGRVTVPLYLYTYNKGSLTNSKALPRLDQDKKQLSTLMKRLAATVFLSTLYTTAPSVPNVILVHDMIPEEFHWDFTQPEWRAKQQAVHNATEIVTVSRQTSLALEKYYPDKKRVENITLSYNRSVFYPRPNRTDRNYLLIIGPRRGYKGGEMLFKAIDAYPTLLTTRGIKFVGNQPLTQHEAAVLRRARISFKHYGWLSDDDLASIYSSASALVYLSIREGFGLPVLEAMACGCPVVLLKTNTASLHVASPTVAFVVDPTRTSKQLLTVINQAATPTLLRKTKVRKGITRALHWPTWRDITMSFTDILTGAIDSP